MTFRTVDVRRNWCDLFGKYFNNETKIDPKNDKIPLIVFVTRK